MNIREVIKQGFLVAVSVFSLLGLTSPAMGQENIYDWNECVESGGYMNPRTGVCEWSSSSGATSGNSTTLPTLSPSPTPRTSAPPRQTPTPSASAPTNSNSCPLPNKPDTNGVCMTPGGNKYDPKNPQTNSGGGQSDLCDGENMSLDANGICRYTPIQQGLAGKGKLSEIITTIINILLVLSGMIAVVFIIIGGFQYMVSRGSEENATKGKKTITNAVIGLIAVIMSFAIVSLITNALTSRDPVEGVIGGGSGGDSGSGGTGGGGGSSESPPRP